MTVLAKIQQQIKAPKGQFNKFGNYKYRSCEDILESVKQIITPLGYHITLTDDIIEIGGRVYVKATATLSNGTESYTTTAFAREEENKKGMDGSQITGASSSYARKYALNGLFAIDDTKDSDHTNNGSENIPAPKRSIDGSVIKNESIVNGPATPLNENIKPLNSLTEKQMAGIFKRIDAGEKLYQKTKTAFALTARQDELIFEREKSVNTK